MRSPLNDAIIEALERARREQRPIEVWQNRRRQSIRVQASDDCPPSMAAWALVKIVNPDDATGDVVVER